MAHLVSTGNQTLNLNMTQRVTQLKAQNILFYSPSEHKTIKGVVLYVVEFFSIVSVNEIVNKNILKVVGTTLLYKKS